MKNKCINCGLVNRDEAEQCLRCKTTVKSQAHRRPGHGILARVVVCTLVCVVMLLGFYLSLVLSARPLSMGQKNTVASAIEVLKAQGFSDEARWLGTVTVFRSEDNWLNAAVAKENAYAAANFPFAIITLYPDFFTYPVDDTERAAILLHEVRHVMGEDEKEAYEYVWKHRKQLGWTRDRYNASPVWENIRRQTRENVPNLFICDFNEFHDCTEAVAVGSRR